ncbi:hypothetical protein jhhlp_006831 [Lomentospora prolificans]|uniref:C2H2-type domain-containing protein n=1 Tax=Lomentospora prolificans TaxID=41688 RepID=A0A2N3N2V9_9PEZI|nr:hypothetical protein jhhlp_006831 [Lomentospora prolificans]
MSSRPWPENGPGQQAQGSDSLNDEQLVTYLASRYSASELSHLFRRAGVVGPVIPDDQASTMSSSTYASSILSEKPPSIFDGSSIRSFSDTASIAGSILSNAPSKSAGMVHGSSQVHGEATPRNSQDGSLSGAEVSPEPARSSDSLSNGAGASAAKPKASFMCAFCNEEGIVKTCTRKNDLKRHIEDFHNTNAQWRCRHRGCELVFDWQTAYKAHLKQAHGGSRMSLDEAKVNLCPQVVFACGFDNCLQVFEAARDSEAQHIFKEYVSHVVKHFDDGAQSGQWTYSNRMRNLLRQIQVGRAWAECGLDDLAKAKLEWHPQTSSVLRKRLECRHIGDISLLIHYALCLGSDPARASKPREDFVTPFRDTCTEAAPGHNTLKRPITQESEDPFNFRISRGSNPALAQYINAQRRLYVPRQSGPVRRPRQSIPTSTPTSNPMNNPSLSGQLSSHLSEHISGASGSYFPTSVADGQPSSPSYDASATTPHSFSPPSGMMHHPQHRRMITDDMHSLRSIASSSPEPDITMGESPMLLSTGFSTPYAGSLHSPCSPDSIGSPTGLESNHAQSFYHDDHHHHQPAVRHPHAY